MLHGRTIVARVYGADNGVAGPTMVAGLTMNFAATAPCGTASAFAGKSVICLQTNERFSATFDTQLELSNSQNSKLCKEESSNQISTMRATKGHSKR